MANTIILVITSNSVVIDNLVLIVANMAHNFYVYLIISYECLSKINRHIKFNLIIIIKLLIIILFTHNRYQHSL